MSDLLQRSAGTLAALVRAGEVTPRELVEASLRRIDELQPRVNAFTHVAHDAALAEAETILPGDPRPFAGVPIAVKDNRPVTRMPLTMGSDLFGEFVPDHDAYLVRRLRAAGFVIVGKTSMPEMGILPTTEPRRFGPTRNPWDLGRTPGGSSGGAAAAVAGGMVPLAHGNDGGGSIRIPAACCGLVGLKPARGRVSVGPDGGQSFLVSDGVLTRSVADTAQVLDVLSGPEIGDASWAPPPPAAGYTALVKVDPGRLRIALALEPALDGATVDPICEQGGPRRRGAARVARPPRAGDHRPLVGPEPAARLHPRVRSSDLADHVRRGSDRRTRPDRRRRRAAHLGGLRHALEQDTIKYLSAQARLESVARSLVQKLSDYDVVLTPALAERPVPIGEIDGLGPDPMDKYRKSGQFTPFTAIVNVTGQPAIALPLYHGEDGLPTAVQLIGPPAREEVLLSLAAQVEAALPWADREPPL